MRRAAILLSAVIGLGLLASSAYAGPGDIEFDDEEVSCSIAVGTKGSSSSDAPWAALAGLVAVGAVVRRKRSKRD